MYDLFDITGKVAIVVGSTRGIGYGIAKGFAMAGAKLVIVSSHQEDCDKKAQEITELTGAEAIGIETNVRDIDSINHLIERVLEHYGHIDILVNSAGINVRKDSVDFTTEDWDLVQEVQLKGYFFMCQAVGRYFIENNVKGKIVNISSIDAFVVSRSNIISYMAAKGACAQMTKALAVEWADKGICVNSIAPGYFETEMTKVLFTDPATREELFASIPQKRFGDPYADLSGIAIYFASAASDYATGQIVCVDGGYTLI